MMTVAEAISSRYSCRNYSAYKIPGREQIEELLECARLAPSAVNRQPWRFVVVRAGDDAGRRAVLDAYPRDWMVSAPCYIVVCGVPAEAWVRGCDGHGHLDIDVAIAAEHICLAATAAGLGSCWVCNFDPAVLSAGLELPEEVIPKVIIPIGYPADAGIPGKKRKPLSEIIIER